MNRLGKSASLPTKEEIALRGELVKQMLAVVRDRVDATDTEHCVVICLTDEGVPSVYHTYGANLPSGEVAQLLEDIATMARKGNT